MSKQSDREAMAVGKALLGDHTISAAVDDGELSFSPAPLTFYVFSRKDSVAIARKILKQNREADRDSA